MLTSEIISHEKNPERWKKVARLFNLDDGKKQLWQYLGTVQGEEYYRHRYRNCDYIHQVAAIEPGEP